MKRIINIKNMNKLKKQNEIFKKIIPTLENGDFTDFNLDTILLQNNFKRRLHTQWKISIILRINKYILRKQNIINGQASNKALGRDNLLLTWPADNQIGIAIHIIDIK